MSATYPGRSNSIQADRGGRIVSTAVIRGRAVPSSSGPAVGTLAHATAAAAITIEHVTPVRTHSLTVLAYNIMTRVKTIAPKATGSPFFGGDCLHTCHNVVR